MNATVLPNNASSPLLRRALFVDTLLALGFGALFLLAADALAAALQLPAGLLWWLGIIFLPYGLFLAYVTRRAETVRPAVWTIVTINALWPIATVTALLSGLLTPNVAGTAFLLTQAAVVALLGVLQAVGVRQLAE
jgi:hypothetical protein